MKRGYMPEKKIDPEKINCEVRIKKISILIFIWSSFIFFLGLQYKFSDESNIFLFWFSILLLISVVLYQIFFITDKKFILFEIFIIYLVLHLIYVLGYYGLRGSDPYIDFNIFKEILKTGTFNLETGAKGYPMLHIFSSVLHFFSQVNPLLIAKFFPSFISSLIVLPIYLVTIAVYHDERVALFSCLIFGTVTQFVSFDSSYVRELFGLFMMIFFFYMLGASIRKRYSSYYLIVFILIPIVIFSHHLSSFLLLCLLIIYLIISIVLIYFNKILHYINRKIQIINKIPTKINKKILLVVIVFSIFLVIYWWGILGYDLIYLLRVTLYDAIGIRTGTGATYSEYMNLAAPKVTIKGNIVYYGFFFYIFIFSILLLIKIFIKNITNKIEDTSFILFYFICMVLGFSTLFFISGSVFPDRFIPFAYMFGLMPLVGLLLILNRNMGKKIIVVLLISFIVFNLYNVDTQNYTYNASYTGGCPTEKEYLIAQRINFSDNYFGYIALIAAVYDIQNIPQRTGGLDLEYMYMIDFHNSSLMAVIDESMYDYDLINFKQKSPIRYHRIIELISYKNYVGVNKICDFGLIYVIKGGE
jgi:hypothetical protein